MNDRAEFAMELARIQKRRRQVWLVLFSYIPVCVLADWLLSRLTEDPSRLVGALAVSWLLLYLVVILRASFSRCPRCGEFFHMRHVRRMLYWGDPWARSCLHCGLPLQPQVRTSVPTV